nr:MAG TPA: hypothetical protein [Caudoviricetes sp.]
MADNNKAVGLLAAAKLVTLIKAETAKKYDKTGGKIEGSAEITGSLKVGMSSEFSSSIKAGSEISSDMLLMAPIVALHDPATEESISFGVSGENAAKVTSPVSGGGVQYARLAVGTPTGDNDAATKAYVDGLAEVITVTSTDVSDLGYDASEGAHTFAVTFDASFDSILANLRADKPMKFNITIPDDTGGFPISFNTGYFSALADNMFEFTGTIAGAPIVLSIGGLGSASVYLYADYLPEPNPDDSDDGKVLMVNKHKWELKETSAGDFMITATLASGGTATLDKTFAQIRDAITGGRAVFMQIVDPKGGSTIHASLVNDTPTNLMFSAADRNGFYSVLNVVSVNSDDSCTVSHETMPVLDSNLALPQLSMASTPDADMEIATKKYVDDHPGKDAVLYTPQTLTFEQKQRARNNIEALPVVGAATGGTVSMCPDYHIVDSNAAVHIVPTKVDDSDYTITLDCGPENWPVRVKGIRTPTDAQTDYAANVAYVKAKISEVAASGGVIVDTELSSTSANPVQNKVVKTALDAKMNKSGGTFTGNVYGKYFCGTWLQSTAASDLGRTPGRIAVLDDSGWVYYRTASEILDDIGGASKKYVDDHATGGATKVNLSGTVEGEVVGYTAATYQEIVNEISKNCNIWLTVEGETIRLASWKQSGAAAYKLVFFGAGSAALTVKYEVTVSASSAALTVTGG